MLRYQTIPKFAELSGYTAGTIQSKIWDGIWRDGQDWQRAPDGRILVNVDGYHRWVEGASALQVVKKLAPHG